ncbi:MAG TPA: ABC transporter ATP-binding protein [Terriglobales bacterium]|nr:ABC transporter ATP-binding protein [Terriglobales bacterium]
MADAHQEEEVLGKAYDSRLMKRLLKYLAPYKWQTLLALFAILIKACCDVLGPYLTKVAIDKYLGSSRAGAVHPFLDSWLSKTPLVGIAQIAAIYVALLMIAFCMEFIQTYSMLWVGQKAMFDMRSQIFTHLQRLHVGFFDRNPVGRLVTRTTTDVDAVNEMFTSGVVSIFEDVFVLSGIVIIMLWISWPAWWLAMVTFSVLPFIFWATMIFRRKVRESYRRIRVAIARINAYLQEHVSGMVVLQLFNREARAFDSFSEVNALHMDAFKDAILAYSIYYPIVEILSAVAIASVIWFGGGQAIRNAALLGTIVAFIQYAQRFFRPIQDLSEKYNILQSAMASSERIFKLLDAQVEIANPPVPRHVEGPGGIEFQHVWFAYNRVQAKKHESNGHPSQDDGVAAEPEWVLRDVSFTIEPGETVAIVGHTGAGKTTIISLLLRFYDIQRGSIKIDGVDLREMDLGELRRRYGVVLQDPFLFSGTISDNVRLGSKWVTPEMVAKATDDVNIGEFIRHLPQGFDEPVRERGSTLSTGQKQLISFARALAHQPKILILDEATSSVDTETELRVRDALTNMVEGRTSIIIAHRLSTVQRADKIIVMHKAQLREMGSHQELLAQRGIYWKLYQLQYKDQELAAEMRPGTLIGGDD